MTIPIQYAEQMELNSELPDIKHPEERRQALQGVLDDAVERANELMIGKIAPQEKTKRRILAIIFLSGIIVAYFFVFRKIFRIFTPPASDGVNQIRWGFAKYKWAYILLLPAVLTIFTWSYLPFARVSMMAFFDYRILGDSIFLGVDNLASLVDSMWWQSVWNAIRYSHLVIP